MKKLFIIFALFLFCGAVFADETIIEDGLEDVSNDVQSVSKQIVVAAEINSGAAPAATAAMGKCLFVCNIPASGGQLL